jgi:excisionase family DNA binding protein
MEQLPIEVKGSTAPFLKSEELAKLLRVKPQTVLDWARRSPNFPHTMLPGSIRVRLSEVEKWLEQFQDRTPGDKE